MSESEKDVSSTSSESESNDSDEMEVVVRVQPYEDEPLANSSDEEQAQDEELDEDGLSPAVLRARFEGQVPLNQWCKCGQCNVQNLASAREFRCCWEVPQALNKLTFDGSIEHIKCVTKHDDYTAMTNKTVLLQVSPLLKDKNGRGYRRRAGQSENDFLRAVAYRWLIRWICGYMGWDNTRPLPACVYQEIRHRFHTFQARGYQSAQERT